MNALKKFMETQLEDYNQMPGTVPMSLVLFRDAIEHSASENTTHTVNNSVTFIWPSQSGVTQSSSDRVCFQPTDDVFPPQ